jgi:hypothetical protein
MLLELNLEMENNNVTDKITIPLFSRIIYGLLWLLSFTIIFYTYGKNENISLARYFKSSCLYMEEQIKTLFYKIWLSMKMKGDAIKINYNEYNILDNSLDIGEN